MPSHPKCEKRTQNVSESAKHSGGPFKRSGTSAKEWDDVVGPPLNSTSAQQLPSVRTILQRYRALRIDKKISDTTSLAQVIASEVQTVWGKARVLTRNHQNCVKAIYRCHTHLEKKPQSR